MKLEKASLTPPSGLEQFLADLGEGENGFRGSPVHSGEVSLHQYLQACCDMADASKVAPDVVPQTIFWVLDSKETVIGMAKVRHHLNDKTRINGGHIGFFIHPHQRGKGYGKQALALALEELKKLGVDKALITVYPENIPSVNIIQANGGKYSDETSGPQTGKTIHRYWISL